MKLYLQGHDYRYAVEQMMMTLFPGQRPEYPESDPQGDSPAAQVSYKERDGVLTAQATLWWESGEYHGQRTAAASELTGGLEDDRVRQRIIRLAFYDAGVAALGHEPPWGALTGVRPVKLPTRLISAGGTEEEAKALLTGLYRVSEGRAELSMDCTRAALAVKNSLEPAQISLYVGIPFCPTRCAYCSFISADVKGALAMVEPYVAALCEEIEALPHLALQGLMTMAPHCERADEYRPYFKAARLLAQDIWQALGKEGEPLLSMGMSESFPEAVAEGAAMVRVGRRLFLKEEQ